MTEEIKATRLSKAAREFNVGIATIVDFLHKKGFDLDPNPNTKLPQEAYALLVKEFSTDISAKKESERLALKDLHKKKETVSIEDISEKAPSEESERDEEVLIKDTSVAKKLIDVRTEIKKPDIKLVGKIDLEKPKKPKAEPPAETAEQKAPKEPAQPEKTEQKKTAATVETPAVEEKKKAKPGVELHIVGKIDLAAVTPEEKHPAKEKKKDEKEAEAKKETGPAEKTPEPEPIVEKIPEPAEKEPEMIPEEEPVREQEEEKVEVFKTPVEKLSGITVLGKIELPVEEKKKTPPFQPVKIDSDQDFRRKKRRKRISKEKEQVQVLKPLPSDKKEKPGKKPLKKRPVRAEIDEEEVQKQIKETLARLTSKGKSKGSRYRREKREAISQRQKEAVDKIEQEKNILKVTEFV
ncbi:MAG: hypothetical protein HPY62_08865 [Bacteroidales bacterium]|nr:hypothetical protein [Bacteroidales bacterium]